jgi:hypothetical protein
MYSVVAVGETAMLPFAQGTLPMPMLMLQVVALATPLHDSVDDAPR